MLWNACAWTRRIRQKQHPAAARAQGAFGELRYMKQKVLEGYFFGAFDAYIYEDIIDADFRSCATEGTHCLEMKRFRCQAFRLDCPGLVTEEERDPYSYGQQGYSYAESTR